MVATNSFAVLSVCAVFCPCDAAIARRRKVALEIRLGKIMNPPKHTPVLDCLAPACAVGASSVPASMPQPSVNIVDVPAVNFVNVVPAGPVPAAVEVHDVPPINASTIPLNFNVDAPALFQTRLCPPILP